VQGVAAEMASVSKRLGLPVMCSFNGVELRAAPSSTIKDVLSEYDDDLAFKIRAEQRLNSGLRR
jgi:hypothetical protein